MIDVSKFVRLLPLLLAVAAGPCVAQNAPADDGTGDPEAPPRYSVEVIVFEYAEDVGVGTERFEPRAYTAPADDDGSAPSTENGKSSPSAPPRPAARFVMLPLDENEFGMNNIHDMLRRLDVYEPLMHVAWMQTALPEENTPALRLDRLGPVPDGLDGTLKLYLGRFVHLVVDVSLDADMASTGNEPQRFEPFETPEDRDLRQSDERWRDDSLELLYEPVRYRIREDRIMKTGETRYFDHPRFGIIARVTRIEENGSASSTPGAR